MRRRESRRRSRHNRTSKSPAMWPGFLAAQIVREYSLLLIFLCKIFPEKLDKARGGRRGILDSPFQSTPPARGATCNFDCRLDLGLLFQSTPPARGATSRARLSPRPLCHFNPRPPRGGDGMDAGAEEKSMYHFNPRPPRGGRQSNCSVRYPPDQDFNPRPPRGGRPLFSERSLWM